MNAPLWAQDLVLRVALDAGREVLPILVWRWHDDYYTSGRAWSPALGTPQGWRDGRIVITAGNHRPDQLLGILHELAHWLAEDADEGHDAAFWDRAWALYRRHKVPIGYARLREGRYRKGSIAAHRRSVTPRAPGSIAGQRPLQPVALAAPQNARTGLSRSPVNTRNENPGAAREEILD